MHDSYDANTEGCDKTCMRIDPEREHILGGVGVQPRIDTNQPPQS